MELSVSYTKTYSTFISLEKLWYRQSWNSIHFIFFSYSSLKQPWLNHACSCATRDRVSSKKYLSLPSSNNCKLYTSAFPSPFPSLLPCNKSVSILIQKKKIINFLYFCVSRGKQWCHSCHRAWCKGWSSSSAGQSTLQSGSLCWVPRCIQERKSYRRCVYILLDKITKFSLL